LRGKGEVASHELHCTAGLLSFECERVAAKFPHRAVPVPSAAPCPQLGLQASGGEPFQVGRLQANPGEGMIVVVKKTAHAGLGPPAGLGFMAAVIDRLLQADPAQPSCLIPSL